jgi:hypothetical protein
LSHNWARDKLGRDNHQRVSLLNDFMKQRGIVTWFDAEKMEGNTRQTMADAISASRIIIVFVTELYRDKIESGKGTDNCFYEFNYTMSSRTTEDVQVVVMEPTMLNTANWGSRLRAECGSLLYENLSEDGPKFEESCDEIVKRIKKKLCSLNRPGTKKPADGGATPVVVGTVLSVSPPPAPVETTSSERLNIPEITTGVSSPSSPFPVTTTTKEEETSVPQYAVAWEIIDPNTVDSKVSSNPEELKSLVKSLGLTSAEDMRFLDGEVEVHQQILTFLNFISKKRYSEALKLKR